MKLLLTDIARQILEGKEVLVEVSIKNKVKIEISDFLDDLAQFMEFLEEGELPENEKELKQISDYIKKINKMISGKSPLDFIDY